MNTKLSITSLFFALFLTACNSSASSDAKKIEVKQVAATSSAVAEPTESAASTSVAKTDDSMKLASAGFIEGQHYVKLIPEMSTDVAPGKIEVAELFWFGCPHCYSMEPTIIKYKQNHPEYVEFKQVPAMLNPSWAADANTFFIADILDPTASKDMVTKIFQSIHDQKRRLRSPKAVVRFFVEQGYTEEQVAAVKSSLAFQTKLVRAQEFGRGAQANSVPSMIVNGKYRTSPAMAGGNQKVMEVVRLLAEKENKSK
ncbi:MAG: thiol:disulfide interchange protein DsbA/DsbL [Cocleimonas sp.]